MSRNDDGLPMLPPWLSESDVTQVGYEAPVQNLPSEDEGAAPRRSRFRNRAPEGERPEAGRREKRRRGWRRGDDAPAPASEYAEAGGGEPERPGIPSSGVAPLASDGGNGRADFRTRQAEVAPGVGEPGFGQLRGESAPSGEYGFARQGESAPSAEYSQARQGEFVPSAEYGQARQGESAPSGENGFAQQGEFAPGARPERAAERPPDGAGDGAPGFEGQRESMAAESRGDERSGLGRPGFGTAEPEDEVLRDPRTGAAAPEESSRPTLPTRSPSRPSSAFQPLGAGASAAGGLRDTSGVRERRRARPELPPPPEAPERLPAPSGAVDEEPEEAAPHRDLAGFREGLSALHREAEPELDDDEPLERGQIGTPDALPPRAPVAPVTGGSVPPWQGPTGAGRGYEPPPVEQPERAPEPPAPEPDPSAYRSAPNIPVAPQQFDVPAAGPLYPPAPPHAAPTAYPTPPSGNGTAAPAPAPAPPPYSTAPTNEMPSPYGPGANQEAAYGDPNQRYRSEPNQPVANQVPPQYSPGPNHALPNQVPPQYHSDPNHPIANQVPPQYRSEPNHPVANQVPPQYHADPNQPPQQYGPGPNQYPGNQVPPYGPGPNQFQQVRQFNATPPNTYSSTPPPSLDDVPMRRAKKSPGSGWRKAVHHVSGGAINPGMSAEERRLQELVARIRQPVRGDYRIAVLSLKGGVGKTTTTMGLGSIFASIRGDRVIAVDANPDFGTLSQRVPLQTRSTVRDLLLDPAIQRYSDVRRHTSQSTSRLEVLASERDPAASEAFSDEEYRAVARILQRFYNIILTDCGTGLMHSAMTGVLDTAHSLVLISSAAIDGARSAAATLDWLSLHGHDHLVRNAVVVINLPREGSPTVGVQHLREYFLSRCRAVHIIPYDNHLSEGAEIDLHRLHKNTKRAYVELAATVADEFAVFRG
ncbi:nucleotide-binding protein [Nocardia harenae]|uniref:nucleotide-binding protein n=1 Tax=Nocardia harenae TaxID=358707 RepID=UPI000AABFC15|nr:AAA family ATPase [Nocardia harenae]